eukprot:11701235-Ditylum_brightwellii.AAC.1
MVSLHTHASSIAIYPEPIPNPVSSLASESGPTRTLHSSGLILHPSPPIPQCRDAVVHEYNIPTNKKSSSVAGGVAAGGGGRGLGVPTTVGMMTNTSNANGTTPSQPGSGYIAATALQKLMSRAILTFNPMDAFSFQPPPTMPSSPNDKRMKEPTSALTQKASKYLCKCIFKYQYTIKFTYDWKCNV